MKLTEKEKRAVIILRQLDAQQREHILGHIQRQFMANRLMQRIAKLRRLRTVEDRKVEKAFGRPMPHKTA